MVFVRSQYFSWTKGRGPGFCQVYYYLGFFYYSDSMINTIRCYCILFVLFKITKMVLFISFNLYCTSTQKFHNLFKKFNSDIKKHNFFKNLRTPVLTDRIPVLIYSHV